MPKKYNDYYDHDNKVQLKPQTWKCDKCEYTTQVLAAQDVSHQCPKNGKKVTFLKQVDKKVVKKVVEKVDKIEKVDKEVK